MQTAVCSQVDQPLMGFQLLLNKMKHYLREQRSLLSLLLQTVSHQSLHSLGTVAAYLTEVRGQVPSTHHKNDLQERVQSSEIRNFPENTCLLS